MKGYRNILVLLITRFMVSSATSANCGSLQSGDVIADVLHCSQFFLCANGFLIPVQCKPPLLFDPTVGACTKDAECPSSSMTTVSTTVTTAGTTVPTPPTPTPTSPFPTAPTAPTPPTPAPITFFPAAPSPSSILARIRPNTFAIKQFPCDPNRCTGIPTGSYLNNPESCQHFVYCYEGFEVPAVCPVNQLFNPVTSECADANSVTCA